MPDSGNCGRFHGYPVRCIVTAARGRDDATNRGRLWGMGAVHQFDAMGFVVRWLMAFLLLAATYNPSGYSYFHWVMQDPPADRLFQGIVGSALMFCYFVFIDITRRSLHAFGLLTVTIMCSLVAVWLAREGWVDVDRRAHFDLLVLGTIATVLAIGLSYSHVHYRLGGVKQVEEV